jgi:AcrR family transcriptional regulator
MSSTRSYSSPTRQAEAAATRSRIVDAAARLFTRDGYAATPLRAIAVEAGVSVQSVHLAGPKASLLIAAFERSFAGDEGRHPLYERPEIQAIVAEADTEKAIDLYVDFIARANERSAAIVRAMKAAADADPTAREAVDDLDQRRRSEMSYAAMLFVQRGLTTAERAPYLADVLGYLTAPESYHYFVHDTHWSVDTYATWLGRSIRDAVRAD